jgi:hypothetical protein
MTTVEVEQPSAVSAYLAVGATPWAAKKASIFFQPSSLAA